MLSSIRFAVDKANHCFPPTFQADQEKIDQFAQIIFDIFIIATPFVVSSLMGRLASLPKDRPLLLTAILFWGILSLAKSQFVKNQTGLILRELNENNDHEKIAKSAYALALQALRMNVSTSLGISAGLFYHGVLFSLRMSNGFGLSIIYIGLSLSSLYDSYRSYQYVRKLESNRVVFLSEMQKGLKLAEQSQTTLLDGWKEYLRELPLHYFVENVLGNWGTNMSNAHQQTLDREQQTRNQETSAPPPGNEDSDS